MTTQARSKPTRLAMLEAHTSTLEKCVYCPKLCRASCPVSNVEPTESLTPWGKMSASYFLGRGDMALEADTASVAWGCTGCGACKERCDHRNDVATTLRDTRAEAFARGAAPETARRVAADHRTRGMAIAARAAEVFASEPAPQGSAAVVVGCGYHLFDLRASTGARLDALAVRAVSRLLGDSPPRVIDVCCGAPLLDAGDREGFVRAAETFAAAAAAADPLVAVDPGCARTIATDYPRVGVTLRAPTLLVDLAAKSVDKLSTAPLGEAPRYHDPCQLARGLGRVDEPRRILAKVAGAPPREFQRNGTMTECSGGGGLLPVTMPEASREIADRRLAEHRAKGDGKLVTACASSLRRFRASGEQADDLIEWIARGLGLP
ncbi:MAG: (Fe-S)-binding protein [Polyangiaceae bacterium]